MHNTNRMIARAWAGREQARFESTAPAAYSKLATEQGTTATPRLTTSLLLNI